MNLKRSVGCKIKAEVFSKTDDHTDVVVRAMQGVKAELTEVREHF